MAWNIEERFPSWGETGAFPPAGFFYEGGDQVNEKHLDALWNGLNGLEEDVQAALSDIDSDGDGVVDKADALAAAAVLDGDLVAADSELLWDESNNYIPQGRLQNDSLTVAGNSVSLGGSTDIALGDLSNVTATGEGSGNGFDADQVDGQDFSDIQNWVNNNADVPNADYADSAGSASGLDGYSTQDLMPFAVNKDVVRYNTNKSDSFSGYTNQNWAEVARITIDRSSRYYLTVSISADSNTGVYGSIYIRCIRQSDDVEVLSDNQQAGVASDTLYKDIMGESGTETYIMEAKAEDGASDGISADGSIEGGTEYKVNEL